MKVRQNLSFASNVRNPFVCAFGYVRRIINISSQFLDERGEWICSVKSETLLKASYTFSKLESKLEKVERVLQE